MRKDPEDRPRAKRERRHRRWELIDLAHWIEQHFKLGARPKIHEATEAEVIYAQVLKRIVAHTDDDEDPRKHNAER